MANNQVIASRDAFGKALLELGETKQNLVVVSCDLSGATRTKAFGKKFPERFFEVGIAEQNGIGVAAGLSMEGFRPFISSFGAFITRRAYDQIMISGAYNNAGFVIVGTHSGLAIGKDGATQMGISDINVMKGVPGMTILQPADSREAAQMMTYLASVNSLAYLRLSRRPQEMVTAGDYQFEFAKVKTLREAEGICIFATGDSVLHSFNAAEQLSKKGFEAAVVNVSTLKPLDRDGIIKATEKADTIITVEDASIMGGLGSSVCELIAEAGLSKKIKKIAIEDCFGESGLPDDLYRKHKLDTASIEKAILDFIS